MIRILFIIILDFFSLTFPLSFLLNDELAAEKLTPLGYIYEGRADSAPAVLTVVTTANDLVSNDPFLID